MCLKIPKEDLLVEELQIQKDINNSIDEYQDIKFNAGAGAGKTYALIESLKYIVEKNNDKLKYHNQSIMCITYTNVATNEIKERLGNTNLVKVSTIHERLWDLIKDYQKQLVQVHIENVTRTLVSINNDLTENIEEKVEKVYRKFRELENEKKDSFKEIMIANKALFYEKYDKSAAGYKAIFNPLISELSNSILSNVGNFKKIVSSIYKIENLTNCLEKIESQEEGYKIIKYDSTYNDDSLHRMIISHDTLLDYGLKLIEDYKLLRQIIINKYPYILVDEYQDTNVNVVKIMNLLSEYATEKDYSLFIGYFGDTAQNIYEDGIGEKIDENHSNLELINKRFNRRSTEEIITVINKIRNDSIQQESIFEDKEGGSVKFYTGTSENINSFIQYYKNEWNINDDNKLHCLVLTNKLVAEYNGFKNIYNHFSSCNQYKGKNYDKLNAELLSNDLSKLGKIQNLFYKIIEFKSQFNDSKTSLTKIFEYEIYKDFNFNELQTLVSLLISINGSTLKEYIESIFEKFHESNNSNLKKLIENKLNIQIDYSYESFLNYLLSKLYEGISDDDAAPAKANIEQLLLINFDEYECWYNFINKKEDTDVIYHTYHGTKGEEYDNVIIIMENKFGLDSSKFSSFFKNSIRAGELQGIELEKYTNTKNLLYVSCSRAIKNLRIIYLDDASNFSSGVERIFETIHEYIDG